MSRSEKASAEKHSAHQGSTAREIVLEHQIRTRKLAFVDALRNKGFCCSGRELRRLTSLGICGDCRTGFSKGDCACSLTETCCYHDPTSCYHCGASILEPHQGTCL